MSQHVNEDLIINNVYSAYKEISRPKNSASSGVKKVKIKNTLLNIVFSLLIFTTVGLLLSNWIIIALEKQMPFNFDFIQLNPFEIFNSSLKVAIFFGIYASSPFIILNLSKFWPEKFSLIPIKSLFKFTMWAFVLFAGGALFSFYILIPAILYFVAGFNSNLAKTAISISSYTSFCLQMILLAGLTFELPLFYILLAKTDLISLKKIISNWKPILIGAAVVTFLLTSPDILTQIFSMAGMAALYGLCIFIAKLVEHN